MKKTIISLTEKQMVALTEQAQESGISKSELLRRVIDTYIVSGRNLAKSEKNKAEQNEV
jgi:metal-responsive CopG/Arc/MetJ family transcriptional regulator